MEMMYVELIRQTSDSPARFPYPQRDSSTTSRLECKMFILKRRNLKRAVATNFIGRKTRVYLRKDGDSRALKIIGSLSNHDDDGNKNVTNLHIWLWKTTVFARFARAFFIIGHFADVLVLYVKCPVLQLCGRGEHMTVVHSCLLISEAMVPI